MQNGRLSPVRGRVKKRVGNSPVDTDQSLADNSSFVCSGPERIGCLARSAHQTLAMPGIPDRVPGLD